MCDAFVVVVVVVVIISVEKNKRRKRRIFSSKKINKIKKSAENFPQNKFSPDGGVLDSHPTKGKEGQKVRRNDRLATDFGRVGDFFRRFGVYRGGVSDDWDQREQRRYAICACIYIYIYI